MSSERGKRRRGKNSFSTGNTNGLDDRKFKHLPGNDHSDCRLQFESFDESDPIRTLFTDEGHFIGPKDADCLKSQVVFFSFTCKWSAA